MRRVLVILTNRSEQPGKKRKTGMWFSELVHFHGILSRHDFEIELASPMGGKVPIDELSLKNFFLDIESENYYDDTEFLSCLENTIGIDDVMQNDYDAVYLVGGRGALYDFPDNPKLQRLIKKTFKAGGYVLAIGYGVCGLLNVELNKEKLIARKQITTISPQESLLLNESKSLPFNIREAVQGAGAFYHRTNIPFSSFIIEDGRVITGQNSWSTRAATWRLVEHLMYA